MSNLDNLMSKLNFQVKFGKVHVTLKPNTRRHVTFFGQKIINFVQISHHHRILAKEENNLRSKYH